jgi:glycosyltransferase involved in cell wall biosynthesis
MRPPLRVVRLITWLPIGGIERRLAALLPRLDRALFAPEVICLRERGALADEIEAAGIAVSVERLRSRLSPTGLWRLSRRLRGAAVVHAHMYRASVPGTIAGRLARVPVVLGQIHNVDTWETPRQRWMERRLAHRRTATIAVSRRVQEEVCRTLRLSPERVPIITNGIDLAPFESPLDRGAVRAELRIAQGEVAIVCAARLHPRKNHRGLLQALVRLPADLPPWRLLIAGDGPERATLEKQVVAHGLLPRVRFLGMRDDIPRVLRACDVSVLASEREGFSNVVVESLAAGLPLVATDIGGNAEAIREGETGFLVEPADVEEFAERLARLIANAALRVRMGAAARESAGQFSLDAMVRQTQELYLRLLRDKGAI